MDLTMLELDLKLVFILQIFTYSVVGTGFVLFTTGLVGWVAGASELSCMLKLVSEVN